MASAVCTFIGAFAPLIGRTTQIGFDSSCEACLITDWLVIFAAHEARPLSESMSAVPKPSEPLRQRRKQARPSELSAAALELFVEKGFAATRLDEIAARAGVSKGTLYLYFDSKEALFTAVIRDGILPLIESAEAQLSGMLDDPEGMLRAILFAWWDNVGATPLGGIPKLMIAEAMNFPDVARFYHQNVIERGRRMVEAAITRGIERGLFRPVNLEQTVSLFFVPAMHIAVWRHSLAFCEACQQDPREFLENFLQIFLRGLRATEKGTPE
ncbi:TetR/AcrR family transcriptional regulator [Niveibacterium sp. COAC-50]|uniref:TetR/AcrR family transcriptional regulator n=1 Tax=Niveibacterium sp. COAC-50 TaxID=2729384 RepID=UPI0020A64F64|nr:TetR/AcrR family transcriptional regulator [Niveibacterium sp. COAC-50]